MPPEAPWAYTVVPGDTLIGLHSRLLRPEADWRVVQRLNRITDPRRLRPGSTLFIPLALLREQAASAEVLHAHGEVWLDRVGAARQPLAAGAALNAGDVVSTGAQSSLSLRFADGSRAQLGPSSRLVLNRMIKLGASGRVDTRLRLDAGGAEAQVPPQRPAPRFELQTPVVNLGVRGTEFRGRVDGQRTLAEVLQGRVAAGTQAVNAGFGAVATAGGVVSLRRLLPAPDMSGLPTLVQRLPLQLPLGSAPGATRLRAQVFDMQEPPRLLLEGVFDQPMAAWPTELADGAYELRVRAADADGVEGQAAHHAFVLKARPEAPFLLKPRAGERFVEETVSLAWARNPRAARYRLQLATQPDFVAPLVDRNDLTGTELTAPVPIGTLHWRVASVLADGDTGPWSDTQVFERTAPPPPPPAAPAMQEPRKSDAGIVINWGAAGLPGASYQVQLARDAAFTQGLVDERTSGTEYILTQPEPGTYYVRTRTVAPDGRAGPFSALQIIEVPRSSWWLWLLPLLLLF